MTTEKIILNNFQWTLYTSDNMSRGVLKGNLWEPHLGKFIKSFLREGDVAIDVGACFGWHTLEMARAVGTTGCVHAFEPQKDNQTLLKTNIVDNGFGNVKVYEIALGSISKQTYICNAYSDTDKNLGDSFISPNFSNDDDCIEQQKSVSKAGQLLSINKKSCMSMTLDSIALDKNVKLMKIDVQGFENMVLKGAHKTIGKHRPVMVIEIEEPCVKLFGYSSKDLYDHIRELGYYIYYLDYEYPCDHVCVPTEQVTDFEEKYAGKIHPHTENNSISNNLDNGVTKKLCL
jgi:FkbM family methyltransferase